jgi:hypothetical protein
VGAVVKVVQYVAGDSVAGSIAAIVAGLVGVAWSVATFFVIPVLALEGLGPRDASRRSAGLVRERWGEGLVGSAAIGLAVLLVMALPLVVLFNLAFAVIDVNPSVGAEFGVLTIIALIGVCAMGSALGVIFRVELYRYSTEGQVTGRFAQKDIVAAFRPAGRAPR